MTFVEYDYRLDEIAVKEMKWPTSTMFKQRSRRSYPQSVSWLEAALFKPYNGKTVVVRHFAPRSNCVAPEYEGNALLPYFVSDLSPMIRKHKIDVWCFGHTHTNYDFLGT